MALIPIYCPNESCKHLGFVSVERLPRVLTCSSCGLQSLHAPPPVSADENWQFAVSKERSHQSTTRKREQCSRRKPTTSAWSGRLFYSAGTKSQPLM
jgi:hypothetical protein